MTECLERAIGIDLGGTYIKGAVVDCNGAILGQEQVPTGAGEGPEAVARRIAKMARELWQTGGRCGIPVPGLGVGVPGTVDGRDGKVTFAPNLRWKNVPLAAWLTEALQCPVLMENDAGVAALGEYWVGAGRGARDMLMLTLGTGIGSGLILDGRLRRGASMRGAEAGHMKISAALPCGCGNRGCLETLTAAPAFVRRAREMVAAGRPTCLSVMPDLEAKDVVEAAQAGDAVAREIVAEISSLLGTAIANVVLLLDLDRVVLGGGVARAGKIILEPVARQVACQTAPYRTADVVTAALGNSAGTLGAASLVLKPDTDTGA